MVESAISDTAHDLTAWSERHDHGAFRRLVEGHADMVITVCRRQLGNAAAADDAAQAVFILLARRAQRIRDSASLEGWLYQAAIGVCRNARRAAARRTRHERKAAHAMHQQVAADRDTAAIDWSEFRPRLDEAMNCLNTIERTAVIGHFLLGQSQAIVAERHGLSESAVRRRLDTALEKMRLWFLQRELRIGTGVLALCLASEARSAEPALVESCVQAGLRPEAASGASALASGAVANLGSIALATAAVLIGATAALVGASRHQPEPADIQPPAAMAEPAQQRLRVLWGGAAAPRWVGHEVDDAIAAVRTEDGAPRTDIVSVKTRSDSRIGLAWKDELQFQFDLALSVPRIFTVVVVLCDDRGNWQTNMVHRNELPAGRTKELSMRSVDFTPLNRQRNNQPRPLFIQNIAIHTDTADLRLHAARIVEAIEPNKQQPAGRTTP